MKKFVALLLAVALCLGAALAETAGVTGVWYFNEMGDGGIKISPAVMGMEMTVSLNEDGTASTDAMGELTAGTWAMDGENVVITFDGDPLTFALEDGNLVSEQDGTTITFGKEKAEPKTIDLGEARTDAAMADYNGTWNATLVDFLGALMPVADMGITMEITILDGKVSLKEGTDGEELTTAEGAATVEGGMVTISVPDSDETVSMQLHEGGVLVWVTEMGDGMTMSVCFEKAAE